MNEGLIPKSAEGLQSKHLKRGIKPIMVCMGSSADFILSGNKDLITEFKTQPNTNHNVDYYESTGSVQKKNFLGGSRTWTISAVDDLNKFSEKFYNCTGLIVVGKDKITGKNISFVSHQDPTQFLGSFSKIKKLLRQIKDRLLEIKDRCEEGTIDAVLVGGQYPLFRKKDSEKMREVERRYRQHYLGSIELLSEAVNNQLNFEPIVVNGPKIIHLGDSDDVYFDTQNRRLYFSREEANPGIGSFTQSTIKKEQEKWDGDQKTA